MMFHWQIGDASKLDQNVWLIQLRLGRNYLFRQSIWTPQRFVFIRRFVAFSVWRIL